MRAFRSPRWDSEPSHRGEVHLEPQAASPSSGAVLTDDAAAVQLAFQTQFLRVVKRPQGSMSKWMRFGEAGR